MNFIKSIKYINNFVNRMFYELSNRGSRGPELCYALEFGTRDILSQSKPKNPLSSLKEIIGDGMLWAVPKARRSLEKRMTRRMGLGKMLLPQKNIIICETCGHFHPVHTVCGHCYQKVKEETELMQEAIIKELKLDPVEQEVVVLYENDEKDNRAFKGKRIVELPKERPKWFSKNLLMRDSETVRKLTDKIGSSKTPPTIDK